MLKTFVLLSIFVESPNFCGNPQFFSGFLEESKVQKNGMPLKYNIFCCNVNAFFSTIDQFYAALLKEKKIKRTQTSLQKCTRDKTLVMQRAKS